MALLHSESEEEVASLLREVGYWDDPNFWRLYGDKEGNFAQIGNQQSYPEASLVEKIVNSVDARLMCECRLRGIGPETDDAPTSVRDAVAMFFENRRASENEAGTLANWSRQERTKESRMITLAATGDRPTRGRISKRMCVTITDQGEGQSAQRLPDTILSLNAKNKQRIRFVQGKFNMGGSGALRFCGENGLQLVISRRNPKLAQSEQTDDSTSDDWAFTIVRREEPSDKSGEPVHSEFTYLAPIDADTSPREGRVLSFQSKSMPLMPRHDDAYAREIEWGTAIKLYEYETTVGQSNVLMKDGLLFALERLLPEIALPIRVHECRGYKGEKERSFETPLAGLVVRLEEGRGDSLEPNFPMSVKIKAGGMKMTGKIYAFKEDRAGTYLRDEGVIFGINGQAHGYFPKTIYSRPKRVGLPRLKDSLLVLIDCSTLTARQREDLFMSSRDRLSKKPIRYDVEREIEQMLREHKHLRRLQQERRAKDVDDKLSEEKPLEEVLNKVLRASPALQTIFLQGRRLSKPFDSGRGAERGEESGPEKRNKSDKPFEGRRHPQVFKIRNAEYGAMFRRNSEIGRRCRIDFETDVENEYFDRATDRGIFELENESGGPLPSYSLSLDDGIAHLNMSLPSDTEAGSQLKLRAIVNDSTLMEPFVNQFEITIQPKHGRARNKNRKKKKRHGSGSGEKSTQGGISLPSVIPVRTDDDKWQKYKFNENTACHVVSDPKEEYGKTVLDHTFFINVDNNALKTEMKYSKQDARLLEAKFKYGNVLLGLALLHAGDQSDNDYDDDESQPVQDQIRQVSDAVAPVLLPMIDQLSGLNESELEELGILGEDE